MTDPWFRCKRGTWIGPRHETSVSGLCPFCASQVELILESQHWSDAEAVERGDYPWPAYKKELKPRNWAPHPHPGFRAMWEWARTQLRCFDNVTALQEAYRLATTLTIDIEP